MILGLVRSYKGRNFKIQLDKGWVLCYNRGMNDQQMQLIKQKYGKLIHSISNRISGDNALADHDDNVQDLWIAVMSAIKGYEKKENKSFEQFFDTPGFGKYLKTCLWHSKNSKGSKLTRRKNLTQGNVSITEHEDIVNAVESASLVLDYDQFYDDLPSNLAPDELDVVKMLVVSPEYICENGRVNIRALSKALGRGWETTRKIVDRIGEKIENNL